jgi:hypothetical protein
VPLGGNFTKKANGMGMMGAIQKTAGRPDSNSASVAAIPAGQLTQRQIKLVQADLAARIAALEIRLPLRSLTALLAEIDAIRSTAHRHGFDAVECLARALETHLAQGGGASALYCYLDALQDAVILDPGFQIEQEALLASVALRMGSCP